MDPIFKPIKLYSCNRNKKLIQGENIFPQID